MAKSEPVTARVALAEWVALAPVPVTVNELLPAAAEKLAESVSVEESPEVMVAGLNEAVTPAGNPDAESATDVGPPATTFAVTVYVVDPPWATEALAGERESENSGTTASVTVAERLADGPAPVMVMV